MRDPQSSSQSNLEYVVVAEIREGELVATFTKREATGHLAFRIAKEFKSRGELKQSSFLSEHHIDSLERLLTKTKSFFRAS